MTSPEARRREALVRISRGRPRSSRRRYLVVAVWALVLIACVAVAVGALR